MIITLMRSDSSPNRYYKVVQSDRDNVTYCTCLAWKFSGKDGAARTCKHLRKLGIKVS